MSQESDQARNLNQVFLVAMDAHAGRVCFRVEGGGRYRQITFRELRELTFRVAAYLRRQGLTTGARVVIVAENSLEWMASFLGCLLAGGVAVPLRASLPPDEICRVMGEAGARLAVVQERGLLRCLMQAGPGTGELVSVLLVEGGVPGPGETQMVDPRIAVTSFASQIGRASCRERV